MKIKLREVIGNKGIFIDGDWVESKDQDINGDVRLIQLADIGEGKFIDRSARFLTKQKAKELNCNYLQQGDILIARMPDPIGRACLFPNIGQTCVTVVDVCIVRVDSDIVDNRWLMWILNSPHFRFQLTPFLSGTTRQRISRKNLEQLQIPLPPIAQQRRIASILDKADEIRRKRQEAIKLTEELGRSLFLDMFGDPVTNPNGWELRELKDVLSIVSGQVDPKSEPYIDMPHIGGENIESHTNRLIKIQTPRELGLKSGKYLFRPDDVLYSKIRPYLNKVSIPYFEGVCSADIYPLRVKKSEIEQNFLAYLLRSQFFLDYAEKHSTRTNIPKINRPTLLSFQFPCPPMEKQKKFSDECNKVYDVQKSFKQSITESENLFNSLLQRAFKGEL